MLDEVGAFLRTGEDLAAVDAPGLRRALLEIFLVFLVAGVLVTGLLA